MNADPNIHKVIGIIENLENDLKDAYKPGKQILNKIHRRFKDEDILW